MGKATHPLAEVFGYPTTNLTADAERKRESRICPFNNRVPSCTKDKATDPLGVCSIYHGTGVVITCPIRFTEDWIITEDAAKFFFAEGTQWTSLREVRLTDQNGDSVGNIDYVLVAYDSSGKVTDFGSVEVQAVYISGNVREPFREYMRDRTSNHDMNWKVVGAGYPKPDYLSSSRKRLVPQLLFKGGIISGWGKKQAVIVQRSFFETLPTLPTVDPEDAHIAWMLYDLKPDSERDALRLVQTEVVYTQFLPALNKMTIPEPGTVTDFMSVLQRKLDDSLGAAPDAPTLTDTVLS